jgi:hypothetical protein
MQMCSLHACAARSHRTTPSQRHRAASNTRAREALLKGSRVCFLPPLLLQPCSADTLPSPRKSLPLQGRTATHNPRPWTPCTVHGEHAAPGQHREVRFGGRHRIPARGRPARSAEEPFAPRHNTAPPHRPRSPLLAAGATASTMRPASTPPRSSTPSTSMWPGGALRHRPASQQHGSNHLCSRAAGGRRQDRRGVQSLPRVWPSACGGSQIVRRPKAPRMSTHASACGPALLKVVRISRPTDSWMPRCSSSSRLL